MNKAAPKPNTFQPDIYEKAISQIPDTRPFSILDIGAGEGLPRAVMEAMGYGTPVVITTTGGGKEVVDDGVTGFIQDSTSK